MKKKPLRKRKKILNQNIKVILKTVEKMHKLADKELQQLSQECNVRSYKLKA